MSSSPRIVKVHQLKQTIKQQRPEAAERWNLMFNPHYVMTPDEESKELIRLVEEREKRQTQSAG